MLENVRKQMSPAEANKIGVGFGDWVGCLRETGDCSRTWPGGSADRMAAAAAGSTLRRRISGLVNRRTSGARPP